MYINKIDIYIYIYNLFLIVYPKHEFLQRKTSVLISESSHDLIPGIELLSSI